MPGECFSRSNSNFLLSLRTARRVGLPRGGTNFIKIIAHDKQEQFSTLELLLPSLDCLLGAEVILLVPGSYFTLTAVLAFHKGILNQNASVELLAGSRNEPKRAFGPEEEALWFGASGKRFKDCLQPRAGPGEVPLLRSVRGALKRTEKQMEGTKSCGISQTVI